VLVKTEVPSHLLSMAGHFTACGITVYSVHVLQQSSANLLTVIVSCIAAVFPSLSFQAGDHHDFLSGNHRWYSTSHARPMYCNVCKDAFSGAFSALRK